jgi:predicted transcriptional regulator
MKKATKTPAPKAAKPLFSVRLDPADREALDKAAAEEDRAAAQVARRAIHQWLKEKGYLK